MKKDTLRLFLSVLGLLVLRQTAAANDIEPGKEFYSATRANGSISIDGNLSEWAGVPVLADPRFAVPKGSSTNGTYVLFEQYNGGTWSGPDDQTSAVQVVWDADNVYFGFVVTDDYHENTSGNAWNGDSVQLMIANAARSAQVALYNYSLGGYEDTTGKLVVTDGVIVNHEAGPGGDAACNCPTDAMVTRDSAGKKTIYEIKLPAASLGLTAPLQAGVQFGLGMAINDGDGTEVDGVQYGQAGQDGQRGWGGLGAHSIVFGKTPGETALVTLSTNLPGVERLFLSSIRWDLDSFSFRVNDKGTSILDPASAKLIIDGQTVTLTKSPKSGDATDFTYKRGTLFPAGSSHTYSIEVKDTQGNTVAAQGTFQTEVYVSFPADFATPAGSVDKTKPGFQVRVHQVTATQPDSNARTEQQLAGELGPNQVSDAFTVEPGVINYLDSGASGNFASDALFPAGATGDNIAMEVLTFIEFTAPGLFTMGVNSDDGFRVSVGKDFRDRFDKGSLLGEFNGGRGVADTTFRFVVDTPGIYPFRLTYEQGGGGAAVEWFSVLADGTKVLINDAANAQALKAYSQGPYRGPAYVKQVRPGVGVTVRVSDVSKLEVLLEDADTQVVQGSVKMKYDGANVVPTVSKAGTTTTVTYTPASVGAGTHQVELSYNHSTTPVSTRTVDFSFTIQLTPDDLPANSFWIEAEDFDATGTAVPAAVDTMPYDLGAAGGGNGPYDGVGATFSVDYNNNDSIENPDTATGNTIYRSTGDPNTKGTSVDVYDHTGGVFGTRRPGGFDMTKDYSIGWVDDGEWYNYTRKVPAGVYSAMAALSHGDPLGTPHRLVGTLSLVTGGVGTKNQTLLDLGTFDAPSSGGWGNNNLVPMKATDGSRAVFKADGSTKTYRFTTGAGDYDWFVLVPVSGYPPKVLSASPAGANPSARYAGSVKRNATLDFIITDLNTAVVTNTIHLTLDGTDVTSGTSIAKSGDLTTVHYAPPTVFDAGSAHAYVLSFADNSTPPVMQTNTATFSVNVLGSPGQFLIEAEDFDYGGGQTKSAASTMPYTGTAYRGLGSVLGVDYQNSDGLDSYPYRPAITNNVGANVNMDQTSDVDRGTWSLTANYKIGWVGAGDWQNYTRTFAAGTYQIWAALSYDDLGGADRLNGKMELVTSGVGTTNQALTELGTFDAPGTGGWGVNALVPLKDSSANIATVSLSGTQTLRYSPTSADTDYFLLVPATAGLRISGVKLAGGSVTITWTGTGTLESTASLNPGTTWTTTGNSTGTFTESVGTGNKFYRVKQ